MAKKEKAHIQFERKEQREKDTQRKSDKERE